MFFFGLRIDWLKNSTFTYFIITIPFMAMQCYAAMLSLEINLRLCFLCGHSPTDTRLLVLTRTYVDTGKYEWSKGRVTCSSRTFQSVVAMYTYHITYIICLHVIHNMPICIHAPALYRRLMHVTVGDCIALPMEPFLDQHKVESWRDSSGTQEVTRGYKRLFRGTQEVHSGLFVFSTHQLTQILRRPPGLRKGQAALDTLEELSGGLVGHDVRLLPVAGLVELLAGRPLVDADHGHADGPGGLPDREREVLVVGLDVAAGLRGPHDLADRVEQAVVEVGALEAPEEGSQVLEHLEVRG